LADQLMTPPVETSATTVRPSVELLEVAEVAAILAAASEPSAKLIGGLKEGHLNLLVEVRFVECDRAHWVPVQGLLSEPPAPSSTRLSVQPMWRP
jgi:hypothetical protein